MFANDSFIEELISSLDPSLALAFLEAHAAMIAAGAFAALLFLTLKKARKKLGLKFRLWRLSRKYRKIVLPPHNLPDQGGWFPLELQLCADFYCEYAMARVDLSLYDKAQSYLRKAHELGRKPMPLWARLVVAVLLLAESFLFALILIEFGIDMVTPNQQPYYAFGVGAVLALVLGLITHIAGHEWHRNDLVKYVGDMARKVMHKGRADDASALPVNRKISIAADHLDDDAPVHIQLLSRIRANFDLTPDWRWCKGTGVAISALLLLSFVVRLSVTDFAGDAFAAPAGMPADFSMPDAGTDGWLATGKLSTLGIFSLLFLGIQAVSVYLAREYGFAGLESARAYEVVKSYRTREEFLNRQQARQFEIANAAQAALNGLQQRLIDQITERGTDSEAYQAVRHASDRTFLAYLHLKDHEEKTRAYENL
ncbi:MAG: hypothetical protein H6868_08285 [Rhodospirillales bacterium]|nr:hypothetical protein [Rhodospirillales bacterium]